MKRIFLPVLLLLLINAKASAQGNIITIAGDGVTQYIGDGWPATNYSLAAPAGVCADNYGNVFVADYADSRLRRIDSHDSLFTIGDTSGVPGYSGDGGIAVNAKFNNPNGMCIDAAGNLYISEEYNHTIRKIDKITGLVSTMAGTGSAGFSGDGGVAIAAKMNQPAGICVDNSGNIYIADKGNSRIRKIKVATGLMSTVAGDTISGYSGDGSAATAAKLSYPKGVCVDASGNIFIADFGNNRIRKVDVNTGLISTFAGTGISGYSGDGGVATAASFRNPNNVFMDSHGNLFVSDFGNNVIRKIVPDGHISTIAGNGSTGYSGDGGPATNATFFGPTAIFVNDSDDIFIADGGNSVIRKIAHYTTVVNNVTLDQTCQVFPNPTTGKFAVTIENVSNGNIEIYNTMGRWVFSGYIQSATTTVDISGQPNGVYFVSISTEAGVLTRKIVLMN